MATAFRALVMLSILVGLPAAWVYYGPLPPAAQQMVDRLVAVAKEAAGWRQAEDKAATVALWARAKTQPSPNLPGLSAIEGGIANGVQAEAAPVTLPPPEDRKPPSFREQLEPLLARLRSFGACGYALERWGVGGNLYRFHCEMPLGSSAEVTQQFEAIAADPRSSIEQVVAEIADWQLARRRGGM